MKFWRYDDTRSGASLKKELRILKRSVVILIAAYLLMGIVLAVLTRDQLVGGWVILGLWGLLGLVFFPSCSLPLVSSVTAVPPSTVRPLPTTSWINPCRSPR